MLFMGHHEDDGWLLSTFNLTFRASWEMMLQGVYEAWHYFANVEILVDRKPIEIKPLKTFSRSLKTGIFQFVDC